MICKINWLHLSDLHVKEGDIYDQDIVLNSMIDDIHSIVQSLKSLHFIFITGDLAAAGKPKEYDRVKRFLADLMQVTQVPAEHVICVPGNHDIDRSLISKFSLSAGESLSSRQLVSQLLGNPSELSLFTRRLDGYKQFIVDQFPWGRSLEDNPLLSSTHNFSIDALRLSVLALNSAWLAGSDADKGRILIGERQIREAFDKVEAPDPDIIIALLHHPLSYLKDFDASDVQLLLNRKCDFVLHGHIHELGALNIKSPDSEVFYLAAGATYEGRRENLSYNFVSLDLDNRAASVLLRCFSDRTQAWHADTGAYTTAPDGLIYFSLPERSSHKPRSAIPMRLLQKACTHQVSAEIQRRVGRKYLPDLCYPRPLEEDIVNFILADMQKVQLCELGEKLNKIVPLNLHAPAADSWTGTIEAIGNARMWSDAEPYIEKLLDIVDSKKREVIRQVIDGVMCLRRNCFLVKDKAGSGKTNLLSSLATRDQQSKTLAIFLSCKSDFPKSRSLAEVIVGSLCAALEYLRTEGETVPILPGSLQDIINAVGLTLQNEKAQLVVFLDGINENRDLGALDESITNLLTEWNSLPIKFIITCRDIFWSFFNKTHWNRFLFDKKAHDLPGFEEGQIDNIIKAYFESFRITGRLFGIAREKCRHPLILRFFCEAYRDQQINDFEDLRLKDLFEIYWKRKQQEIAESLGLGSDGGRRLETFLFKIVDYMSDHSATQVSLGDVPQLTGEHDLESDRSIYKHLLDQDIILEELPPENAFDRSYSARRISFVYEEFYNYMMALAHVRKNNWDSKDSRELCLDFMKLIQRSADFEQLRGVPEYLVLISEQKDLSHVLCAVLARLGNYEILCNVLPKLRGETDWMQKVLRNCLLTLVPSKDSRTPIGQLIIETDPEHMCRVLLQE